MDDFEFTLPTLVLAHQHTLFFYQKNQFIKHVNLPLLSFSEREKEIWTELMSPSTSQDKKLSLIHELQELKSLGLHYLSPDSISLTSIEPSAQIEYLEVLLRKYKQTSDLSFPVHITSSSLLKKRDCVDENSVYLLIVGTFERLVYVLNPPKYEVIEKVSLFLKVKKIRLPSL
jgi:hypothetical protein